MTVTFSNEDDHKFHKLTDQCFTANPKLLTKANISVPLTTRTIQPRRYFVATRINQAALAEIAAYRYEAAREKLRQAETELLTAQRLQVRRLIENAKAQRFVHSTLFMNAQSALVNVMGELQMTENLIGAFERWEPEAA